MSSPSKGSLPPISLSSFPVKGLLPSIGVVLAAVLTILIGNAVLGIDPGTLSIFTLFVTWAAFMISTAGGWPLEKFSIPVRGFTFIVISLIYGVFHIWAQPNIFGFSGDYYWPVIANLFLAIGITIAFDNKLVSGLKQPYALIFNILFWYIFTFVLLYLVPVFNGMVPSIWFAWFVFFFFWLGRYPLSELPQPTKGILSLVIMGSLGILLNFIFIWFFNTNFFQPDAGFWFAAWVFWLVITSWIFDTWPFQNLKQPRRGLIGLPLTVALATITYVIVVYGTNISLPDAGSYGWIFISWAYIWPIFLQKWPAKSNS